MTDHEQLSMLLDGELAEPEAQALQDRIAAEPALAQVWATMQALPAALADLPELAPPPELDALVLGDPQALQHASPARWTWAPLALMAAVVLLAFWPRPAPEVLIVTGHQRLSGELSLLAGDVRVELDGEADLFVEPVNPLLRESAPEDPTMTKKQLLAGLAGAAVTVIVYEGTAVLHAADADPVALGAGDQHTLRAQDDPTAAPIARTTRTAAGDDAEALQAEIASLNEQLEAARFHQAMAKGQLASHEGTPQPWPDDLPEALRPDAFSAAVAAAMEGFDDLELVSVECDEFPCFAVIESNNRTEEWGDQLDAVGERLSDAYKETLGTDDVGTGHWRSHYGEDGVDVRIEGMVLGTPEMADDDTKTRTSFRVDSTMKDLAEDRMAEETQAAEE